ncbi:metallophosphoesterase [Fimbriimonas ginsengisoli]|uniref:Metallophosphoesterase n=1 Tax=Fimbriimonas ginsengisoli Gsoil 348 TaxID=661478 RepID=A0A068NN53_FIMGI|nr:metallophosphoesterase [Fimbriimonas ginsengisoli]AIE84891.1 metallophosphoesterase [Fimbriimonas ginsengisoli Gsoil 348]
MSAPRRTKPAPSRRDFLKYAGAGAVCSVLPFGYSQVDTRWLSVEEEEIRLPLWDADGFRAVVLADVHANSAEQAEFAEIAAKAAVNEKPDVILIPGDHLNASDSRHLRNLKRFTDAFADAKCPVLATLGNHDYSSGVEKIVRAFHDSPVRLLRNEIAEVGGVSVAGLDDALYGKHRPEILSDDRLSKSLLTMLHEPDFVDELPRHVSLQVSGHSHGGQICLPFGVALHTPRGAQRYIDGFYPEAPIPVFVTRGVGTTGARYRLFCRPQVAVLTLRAA